MATIREIANEYGVSKSTARRWAQACVPEAFGGGRVVLDDSQMHRLAHFVAQRELPATRGDSVVNGSWSVHAPVHEPFGEPVGEPVLERLRGLELENAALRAANESLERSNELLLERLRVADAALEREQMQARGFWSRLGQKLLGEGGKK